MDIDILNKKLTDNEINFLNPLVLAFIGDAVYEVFVRTHLVEANQNMCVHKLHVRAISFVKAGAQSNIMKDLISELYEDEMRVFKRGRNAKSATIPKNANVQDYRMATGFEAVIGYLYLKDDKERLNYLMKLILKNKEN